MNPKKHPIDVSLDTVDQAASPGSGGSLLPPSGHPPGIETLSAWFRALNELQNSTVEPQQFFTLAARKVCEPGGLDGAAVIMKGTGDSGSCGSWRVVGSFPGCPGKSVFRESLLRLAETRDGTIYHSASRLQGVTPGEPTPTVAVAPVRDEAGTTCGFVYGWREPSDQNKRFGIRTLEAHFVGLVAQAVSSNLTRNRREAEIASKNALLVQAFPARVVESLKTDPEILEGREKEVTILFADLCGFSAISNRLSPRVTSEMVVDIMDEWTGLVREHAGVVVDYFGDGLAAFWNAPLDIENHAALAVTCANRIRDSLPRINQDWQALAGATIEAGIGIATGRAMVGNCGSRKRFKYGPHGSIVNLAARLEKLTRELPGWLLISEETARQVRADYVVRRLCKVRVAGFEQALNVFEVSDADAPGIIHLVCEYEAALHEFEAGNPELARRLVDRLLEKYPHDAATRLLDSSVRRALKPDRRASRPGSIYLPANAAGQT